MVEEAKAVGIPRANYPKPSSGDSTATKRHDLTKKVNELINAHTESGPGTGLNRIDRITDGAATGNSRNSRVVAGQHHMHHTLPNYRKPLGLSFRPAEKLDRPG